MKFLHVITVIASCLVFPVQAVEDKPSSNTVVVKVITTPLPKDERKRKTFLFQCPFAKGSGSKKFSVYTTNQWEDNYKTFSNELVMKADKLKLNSKSLRKALDLIMKESKASVACLPVGAYQTTFKNQLVWVIRLKWERTDEEDAQLGHIRAYAYDQKTLEKVGFATCG